MEPPLHRYRTARGRIAEYVESELSSERTQVLVKAAGDVRYGEVERVRQAISNVLEEGQSVHIAVK